MSNELGDGTNGLGIRLLPQAKPVPQLDNQSSSFSWLSTKYYNNTGLLTSGSSSPPPILLLIPTLKKLLPWKPNQ